jgi:hypothetical protein
MPERYRVRLADGQAFDMHATPAKIRKEHPDSRIEGRIVVDELGQGRVVAYQGEQPAERPTADTAGNSVTIIERNDRAEKVSAKPASKKSG